MNVRYLIRVTALETNLLICAVSGSGRRQSDSTPVDFLYDI
jgi:hypothetical protein